MRESSSGCLGKLRNKSVVIDVSGRLLGVLFFNDSTLFGVAAGNVEKPFEE